MIVGEGKYPFFGAGRFATTFFFGAGRFATTFFFGAGRFTTAFFFPGWVRVFFELGFERGFEDSSSERFELGFWRSAFAVNQSGNVAARAGRLARSLVFRVFGELDFAGVAEIRAELGFFDPTSTVRGLELGFFFAIWRIRAELGFFAAAEGLVRVRDFAELGFFLARLAVRTELGFFTFLRPDSTTTLLFLRARVFFEAMGGSIPYRPAWQHATWQKVQSMSQREDGWLATRSPRKQNSNACLRTLDIDVMRIDAGLREARLHRDEAS